MKLNLISNFAPLHNLNVYMQGFAQGFQEQFNTIPKQFNMYYQVHQVANVVSQGVLIDSVGLTKFPYLWAFSKTPQRPPVVENSSGPHLIYTTYANPVDTDYSNPTNTLGLKLECEKYAKNTNKPHDFYHPAGPMFLADNSDALYNMFSGTAHNINEDSIGSWSVKQSHCSESLSEKL